MYTSTLSAFETLKIPPAMQFAWTMETAFDELLAAKRKGATVRALFDGKTGYVRKAFIEYEDFYWSLDVKEFSAR